MDGIAAALERPPSCLVLRLWPDHWSWGDALGKDFRNAQDRHGFAGRCLRRPRTAFDLQNITVTYSPSSGSSRTLGKAPSSACVGGQWYVSQTDANGNPATLELCPDTCAAAQGDPGAMVEVTFTCLYRQ